jgi:hypothetical protein
MNAKVHVSSSPQYSVLFTSSDKSLLIQKKTPKSVSISYPENLDMSPFRLVHSNISACIGLVEANDGDSLLAFMVQ